MSGFFDYESKPMQILNFFGDLILLNLLYLVCCIPIVTIGAAQAGMFTACKVLLDKEDDSSPYAAFWRGFTTGFGTVTLAWGLTALVTAAVVWLGVASIKAGAAVWLCWIAMGLVFVFMTLIPAFHSRFGCKWWQLITNSWFLFFAHPLRSLGSTLLIWIPGILLIASVAAQSPYDFMAMTPIWGTLYYSTMFCFATTFLKKPFKTLTDHYNELHGIKPEEPKKDRFEEDYDEEYEEVDNEEYPELPAEATEAEAETAEIEPEATPVEPEEAPKI